MNDFMGKIGIALIFLLLLSPLAYVFYLLFMTLFEGTGSCPSTWC